MNKKIWRAMDLLFLATFFLVAIFSVVLTVKFIRPPQQEEAETVTSTEEKVEKDKNESLVGASNGNMIQHYENTDDYGIVDSNNRYIFKYQKVNNQNCLTKIDLKDDSTNVVLTGYKVKNLRIIKKNLYMVIEQREEDNISEVIAYMDIEKNTLTTISQTRADRIISFVSDGTNLYYTISDDHYIYKIDKDDHTEKLFKTNEKADTAVIIGLQNGLIYYVDGVEMCSLGIHSHQNTVLSTQYSSIEQYPIMTKDSIICFYDMAHTKIDIINLDGTYRQTLVDNTRYNSFPSRMIALNYSCGYIFLSTQDGIFYIDKNDNYIKQLEEVNYDSSSFFLTDEYIIGEETQGGSPKYSKIVWLLAS